NLYMGSRAARVHIQEQGGSVITGRLSVTPDLFEVIESDRVAAEFYLANDTDSLHRWIGRLPAVLALEALVASDPPTAELTSSRTLELFLVPVVPGYRSEHEPALCC